MPKLSAAASEIWRELEPLLAGAARDTVAAAARLNPGPHVQQASVTDFDPLHGRADLIIDGPAGGSPVSAVDVASQAVALGERVWVVIWPPHAPMVIGKVGSEGTGGGGCGTPGPPTGGTNTVTGEDSCAENIGNTVDGDESTASGENNTNSGKDSAILAGTGNVIDGPINSNLSSAIIASDNSELNASESVIIGGNTNKILDAANESVILGGDGNIIAFPNTAIALIATGGQCAQSPSSSVGLAEGPCPWISGSQTSFGLGALPFDTGVSEEPRTINQKTIAGGNALTSDASPTPIFEMAPIDYNSLFRITGTVNARTPSGTDVCSTWDIDVVVSWTDAPSARFVGTSPHVTLIDQDAGAVLWAVSVAINAGGSYTNFLEIDVTGDTSTIQWGANLTLEELFS